MWLVQQSGGGGVPADWHTWQHQTKNLLLNLPPLVFKQQLSVCRCLLGDGTQPTNTHTHTTCFFKAMRTKLSFEHIPDVLKANHLESIWPWPLIFHTQDLLSLNNRRLLEVWTGLDWALHQFQSFYSERWLHMSYAETGLNVALKEARGHTQKRQHNWSLVGLCIKVSINRKWLGNRKCVL